MNYGLITFTKKSNRFFSILQKATCKKYFKIRYYSFIPNELLNDNKQIFYEFRHVGNDFNMQKFLEIDSKIAYYSTFNIFDTTSLSTPKRLAILLNMNNLFVCFDENTTDKFIHFVNLYIEKLNELIDFNKKQSIFVINLSNNDKYITEFTKTNLHIKEFLEKQLILNVNLENNENIILENISKQISNIYQNSN